MQQQLAPAPTPRAVASSPLGSAARPDTKALRLLALGAPEQLVMIRRHDLAWLIDAAGVGEAADDAASPFTFDPTRDRPVNPPTWIAPDGSKAAWA